LYTSPETKRRPHLSLWQKTFPSADQATAKGCITVVVDSITQQRNATQRNDGVVIGAIVSSSSTIANAANINIPR